VGAVIAAIEIEAVEAGYDGAPFLRGVSMRVEAGEMAAVLGPNGAGKSTLLRVLTGRHPVTAGTVRLFGRDVARLGAAERAALVAAAPQELSVPMPFTVEEVVGIGRTARLPRWRAPGAEHRRAIEEAMAGMDVLELRARPFEELSGGERQRAVVAMALAQEPRLLLLDEPTSHLDISHRLEILRLIGRMNAERGLTVVMTSHDLNLAAEFCRRLFLFDHGRLVAEGPPEVTLREPLLRTVYHCDLRVRREEDGALTVRPARGSATHAAGAPPAPCSTRYGEPPSKDVPAG
jgi:iron complex transport system ATP-binding protein